MIGALEAALSLAARRVPPSFPWLFRLTDVLSLMTRGAIAAVAIRRTIPAELGIGLTPLETEGGLITVLLGVGVVLAAALFVTARPEEEPA